jgi:protein-L-isoaspartate O-methyltransferase
MSEVHAPYALGSEDAELERLERQAQSIALPTAGLLQASGIGPGMRVLDLGTGLGHVSLQLAALVGPTGEVVGLERDERMLQAAEARRAAAGAANVRYVQGDVRTYRDGEPFDAVVERLVLFHLPDAIDVVRHHLAGVRPGGIMAAIEFDVGAARTEPPTTLTSSLVPWLVAGFRSVQADPTIGTRIGLILAEAGVTGVTGFGVQGYLAPDDPAGPALVAGVVSSMSRAIVAAGIATEAELDLPTLQERIGDELRRARAVFLPPTVVGAWGRKPA